MGDGEKMALTSLCALLMRRMVARGMTIKERLDGVNTWLVMKLPRFFPQACEERGIFKISRFSASFELLI